MIANPGIKNQGFMNVISIKKMFFSIIALFIIVWQVAIINEFGNSSSWGDSVINHIIFGIQINNVQFFFIFAMIGNILILLSAFQKIFGIREDGTNQIIINERQVHFIGLLFYFFGILGYFDFLIFEPFFFLYLVIMAFIYYQVVTLDFSPFFQESNTAFDTSIIMDFSVWHSNTKTLITQFFNSGGEIIEVFLLLCIFFFFVQLGTVFGTQGRLVSERRVTRMQNFVKTNIKLDTSETNNKILVVAVVSLIMISSYLLTFLNASLFVSFVIVLFYFPLLKRHLLTLELVKSSFLTIKVYDFYFLVLLILLVAGFFTGLYASISVVTLFVLSIWLAVKFMDIYGSQTTLEKESPILILNFNTFVSFSFNVILVLYMNAWISSDSSENIFLLILFWAILLKYSPFLIRNFFNAGVMKFSVRRFAIIIPMFIGISMIVFGLMSVVGNPVDVLLQGIQCTATNPTCRIEAAAALEERFGFANPIHVQWGNWFFRFLMGDFGQEFIVGANPVTHTLLNRIGPTMEISFIPLILAVLISVPLGIIASKRQNSVTDNSILMFVAVGIAIPIFFFLLVMIMFFSNFLQILPSFGRRLEADLADVNLSYAEWFHDGLSFDLNIAGTQIFSLSPIQFSNLIAWDKYDWLFHVFIPIVAITILSLALYTRLVRGGMLEIMRNDYILSARASGFSEKVIVNKHALRNVLIPVITVLGLSVGTILGGAPITETVTGWPGLGRYGLNGLLSSDYAVIMATYMVVSFMTLTANLLTDILYSVIDPRVRIE